MFFEPCKMVIHNSNEYFTVINHIMDVFHGYNLNSSNKKGDRFPLYMLISTPDDVDMTYNKSKYDRSKNKPISVKDMKYMKYVISNHFDKRFNDRYEKVSNNRLRKILKNMLKQGTWLKRKDSFQAVKYKKTSDYVLFSQFKNNRKRHYLIVLTNGNILTTIYEFNIKDLKFFKEI